MSVFFSPPMRTVSILVSHLEACSIVHELIETRSAEFELDPTQDVNDPYYIIWGRIKNLKYRVAMALGVMMGKYEEEVRRLSESQKETILREMKEQLQGKQVDYLRYLDEQETKIGEILDSFKFHGESYDKLFEASNLLEQEISLVRSKIRILSEGGLGDNFRMLTGTVGTEDKRVLERLIFRKTKGHAYTIFQSLAVANREIIICVVNESIYRQIESKIKPIFALNRVNLYDLPNELAHLSNYEGLLIKQSENCRQVLEVASKELIHTMRECLFLQDIPAEKSLQAYYTRLTFLERVLYLVCHSKHVGSGSKHVLLIVHLPADYPLPDFGMEILNTVPERRRTIMPMLPWLQQANILTELYSTPRHNEMIPSVFMVITVPVLFGMMFSDMGHGLMLLVVARVLRLSGVVYLMALMSIYCGVIYNQFFGMKIIRCDSLGILEAKWGVAENSLSFQNSLKMKISMVVAFLHMGFGMGLKIANQIKRNQRSLILYDSVPKCLLLLSTVGYLTCLIVLKWLTDFTGSEATAPSIINTMLEMFLGFHVDRKHSIWGSMERERAVVGWLHWIIGVSILVLIYNYSFRHWLQSVIRKYWRKSHRSYDFLPESLDGQISEISSELEAIRDERSDYYSEGEHASELGALEVFEFVLSLISSTTSYLRLFALSLAHAKMSHLLLTFLLAPLSELEPRCSTVRCIVFFVCTFSFMLLLDLMECVMHVVRLHWVEWMGKFYTGSGVRFCPEICQAYQ